MKYTKYFGQVNKDGGLQRISSVQLARIMNLAYLEGRSRGIQESTTSFLKEKNTRKIEVLSFQVSRRITELTGNRDPKALMEEICYLSENDH